MNQNEWKWKRKWSLFTKDFVFLFCHALCGASEMFPKWSIDHPSNQVSLMWKVEKSGRYIYAGSHYLHRFGQMSCVTSWCKAHQNTSGHWNVSATAGADCQFHFARGKCGSSVIVWALQSATGVRLLLIVSVKRVVFTWVVLGFICRVAELNVKVDAKNAVLAVVPGDWRGTGTEMQV